jgi:hypothetical protein
MVKKYYHNVIFVTILSAVSLLLLYQIYIVKKINEELEQIRETRTYYIQFLNAVTLHLKKKILAQ